MTTALNPPPLAVIPQPDAVYYFPAGLVGFHYAGRGYHLQSA